MWAPWPNGQIAVSQAPGQAPSACGRLVLESSWPTSSAPFTLSTDGATAKRSPPLPGNRQVTGTNTGVGLYFNYAFTLIWLGDCVWWHLAKRSHEARPVWLGGVTHGFMAFMWINATVVFGAPFGQSFGWAAPTGLAVWHLLRRRRNKLLQTQLDLLLKQGTTFCNSSSIRLRSAAADSSLPFFDCCSRFSHARANASACRLRAHRPERMNRLPCLGGVHRVNRLLCLGNFPRGIAQEKIDQFTNHGGIPERL